MDCLSNILSFLGRIICKLDTYSGILLVILTAIGFIFIYKQIKIAKNKDIFFELQKEISEYFCDRHKKQCKCHTDFVNILNNKVPPTGREKQTISKIKEEFGTINLGEILDDVLFQYKFEPLNESLIKISSYKWWLGKHYSTLENIFQSEEFEAIFAYYKPYDEIIRNFSLRNVLVIPDKVKQLKTLKYNIFETIKLNFKNYENNDKVLSSKFDKFFEDLAKDKL